MELDYLKGVAEGLLFAGGDEGITVSELSNVLDVSLDEVRQIVDELQTDYKEQNRGLMILNANGMLSLTTKPDHSEYFKKWVIQPKPSRMSQAALETLAIIAYQQPITRTEIDEIRGVRSERPLQTLVSRMLVEECGRKETVGRPTLFRTTKEFLTFFGLSTLEELPELETSLDSEADASDVDLFFDQFPNE
ncbi:Segregation and condensation protein B [Oceanobacillus oncorhynchi]|uniref:Segregation and condensation protein B n=1 Tax=Oceanobacillus oncorhynchi TaxID=545501 RepID=A0A0A1MEM7_9BACI|nr:SMC-Scp complex subunit ScpB [Oceanobacillus oncorhynchi]CEI83790.1 Segregation and condensation protein B [Oceanobacillus oncorhynchi]